MIIIYPAGQRRAGQRNAGRFFELDRLEWCSAHDRENLILDAASCLDGRMEEAPLRGRWVWRPPSWGDQSTFG